MKNHQTSQINRWSIPRFKALSEDAKVLLVYLSISAQTHSYNSLPFSMEGVATDLQWKSERIRRRLKELIAYQLIDLSINKQKLYVKPYLTSLELDKPCLNQSKPLITHHAESASWRDEVRIKLHGTPSKKQQADAAPADIEPPRIFHIAKLDLDEVDYLYLIENQAPGKTLRETLSLHCQVAISIAFEMLFTGRQLDCTGFDTDKLAFRRDAVNTHLKVLTRHQDFFRKHFSHTFGRTDDFIATKMEMGRQNYRQLKFIFFNQPELILEIEAGKITLTRAYRQAKACHSHPLTNPSQES